MTRRITTLVTLAFLTVGASQVWAHDEFRIIGQITKRQDTQLVVKTKDGKTIAIALNGETLISRDKKKVSATELKIGRSVVVDALGDSEADLLALEVRIVPTLAAPAK